MQIGFQSDKLGTTIILSRLDACILELSANKSLSIDWMPVDVRCNDVIPSYIFNDIVVVRQSEDHIEIGCAREQPVRPELVHVIVNVLQRNTRECHRRIVCSVAPWLSRIPRLPPLQHQCRTEASQTL